jgi:hypothetical protein
VGGTQRAWQHSDATLAAVRLDLAYRAVDHLVGDVPPVVLLAVDGEVEMWWPTARGAPAPFVARDPHRWTMSCDLDLSVLARVARHGQLRLDGVTQVGVGADRRLILVDLGHWTHLGVDTDPEHAGAIIDALEAGLGVPPLTIRPHPSTPSALFRVGRSGVGLWLTVRHRTWTLEPLGLWLTPVGAEVIDLPDTSGEPEQRSTS